MAQQKGFRAIIEEPTPDGGRVDVGLTQDEVRIACEVSVTTHDKQELSNIKKCLRADYDQIIICSSDKKALKKLEASIIEQIDPPDKEKLYFFQPEELLSHLEDEAAKLEDGEEKVRGYKVNVQRQPVEEDEKEAKREAVAQVILSSLNRQDE